MPKQESAREISERQRLEEAMRASQLQLAAILTSAMDAIISVDAAQHILLFNQAAERMFGWSAAEIHGHPLSRLLPSRFRRRHHQHIEEFGETGVTTRTIGKLTALSGLRRDGTEFPVEAAISQVEVAGQKIYTVILRDITQRRAVEAAREWSEQRFRALVEHSLDAVALFGVDGTILYGSPSTIRVLGYDPADLIGRNAFDLIHPLDQALATAGLTEALHRPGVGGPLTVRARHQTGVWRWVEAIFTNLLAEPGIQAIVSNYRDVTARKEAEDALHESQARSDGIINSAMDAIITVNADQRIILFNAAAERMFRCRATAVLGQRIDRLIPRRFHEVHQDHIRQFGQTGVTNRAMGALGAISGVRADGEEFPIEAAISQIEASGQTLYTVILRDITERQRADAVKAWLAAIIESSDDAIYGKSLEGIIQSWNQGAVRLYGYTADEAIGQPINMLVLPDRADEIPQILEQIRGGEQVVHLNTVRLRKNGTRVDVSITVSPIRDVTGAITGASTIARDTTEQKRIEAQLQYQANLIANVSDAIISTDSHFMIESWNQAAEAIYGWRADEVLGKSVAKVLSTEYLVGGEAEALQTLSESGTWRGEVIQRRKDGTPLYVLGSVSTLKDGSGQPIGVVTVNRDITERKREEERQQLLAEASQILAGSLDYEATLAAVAHLAVPRLADWCTIHLVAEDGTLEEVAVVHPDPAMVEKAQRLYAPNQHTTGGVWQVIRSGQALFIPEISDELLRAQIHDPDLLQMLRELGLRSAMTVPLLVGGRVLGAIMFVSTRSHHPYTLVDLGLVEELARRAAVAVDNARLYRAAQRLNEELEQRVVARTVQLEFANKELEAFSYSVSHDLRAPLSHIVGFAELLHATAAPILDSKSQRYLTIITEAADRMGTLIDDLLAFSRVGQATLNKVPFAMGLLVQEVITECEQDTRDRQITWHIAALPEVTADRALLRLVWTNLIANALKYSRPRQPAEIEIGYRQDAGETVCFIRDNGVGFDMKYVDKLFGVFQRLHSATRFEGTGIGLANVRRIINRHGGRTWAEGVVEGGATFYFSLPDQAEV